MTLTELLTGTVPAWLTQDVPLWAFLIALLTRPSTWSKRITQYFERDDSNGGRCR